MNPLEVLQILRAELPKPVLLATLRAFRDEIVKREPDVVIGGKADPYMLRWWVVPRNKYDFNVYLHKVLRSDRDTLHDHPWGNVSIVIDGEYIETMPKGTDARPGAPTIKVHRVAGDIVARSATSMHRIELLPVKSHSPGYGLKPCWSLFLTGPKIREWGFACKRGWIPWQQFTGQNESNGPVTEYNNVRGCGEQDTYPGEHQEVLDAIDEHIRGGE